VPKEHVVAPLSRSDHLARAGAGAGTGQPHMACGVGQRANRAAPQPRKPVESVAPHVLVGAG